MNTNRFKFIKGQNKDAKACTLVYMKLHVISQSSAKEFKEFLARGGVEKVDDPPRYQIMIIKLDPKLPRLNKYWAGHELD